MLAHFMACFWIFTANISLEPKVDDDGNPVLDEKGTPMNENTNLILFFRFDKLEVSSLYITAFYYTVTTITTVGYGDIRGTNMIERIVCCLLMVLGVVFFSIASGTFTNIIT